MEHDNIVKLYDYTETNDEYLLYMEYCDKGDYLAQKILEVNLIKTGQNIMMLIDPHPNRKK